MALTPYALEQNGQTERGIRMLKEQCVHRPRFDSLAHTNRVIAALTYSYNLRLLHQTLGMKTPMQVFQQLVARPMQKQLGHYRLALRST
ncbi:integrase core domain-containing protein [Chromobacterium vaccinii]|uniref:integrase core domain-containing protein n=1 Tax=Chromobacterium vaccinii TaxID=1108595 RepID=UPI0034587C49